MKASAEQVRTEYAFSERHACRVLEVAVSSFRYAPRKRDDALREQLVELAREKPRFGYRRLHVLLKRAGEEVNHKRAHRIYRDAGLALRKRSANTRCAPAGRWACTRRRTRSGRWILCMT